MLHERLVQVWDARWLTNGGRQLIDLSEAIRRYLDVPQASIFNNGTIALLAAVRADQAVGSSSSASRCSCLRQSRLASPGRRVL